MGNTSTIARRQSGAVPVRPSAGRPLALGLMLIAVGLAVIAALGPLAAGVIDYRVTQTLRNQVIGLDAVALGVVTPLALVAAGLVLRTRRFGAALALGIGSYTSYMMIQYVVGPDYGHLPGNNERLFPLFLLLFAAGWLVALSAWQALAGEDLGASPRRNRLLGRAVLPLLAFAAFVRYLPGLADWMRTTPVDAGYQAGSAFAWTIALLDLGVFLPATVLACVGLIRRTTWAGEALCLVVGWFALVGCAVAAMAITMSVNDDPNASAGNTFFLTLLGLAFVALAVWVFRPLSNRRG
jgi:hypothetical protein